MQRPHVERLAVARVDQVLRTKQVPNRMEGSLAQATATIASTMIGPFRGEGPWNGP